MPLPETWLAVMLARQCITKWTEFTVLAFFHTPFFLPQGLEELGLEPLCYVSKPSKALLIKAMASFYAGLAKVE